MLMRLLSKAEEHDTQLAALAALGAVFRWCSKDFLSRQLDELPGFGDALVQLLHELPAVGDEDMQAAVMSAVALCFEETHQLPEALGPSPSHPNSWPAASAFAAVLQSPAVSTRCKGHAANALWWLLLDQAPPPTDTAVHPAVQAAIGPLVALLQAEDHDVQRSAAGAIRQLAEGHPANQSLIVAEPGAISRLWQLRRCYELAAVVKGHGINQSRLMAQDGFMDDLLDLLGRDLWGQQSCRSAPRQPRVHPAAVQHPNCSAAADSRAASGIRLGDRSHSGAASVHVQGVPQHHPHPQQPARGGGQAAAAE